MVDNGKEMRVTFWGVRGSIPTPLTPKEVEWKAVQMAEDVVRAGIRDPDKVAGYLRENHSLVTRGTVGGNTTCISVEWPGSMLIFDSGTGIRELGKRMMDGPWGRGNEKINMIMSHTHWDHIMGFPYFAPLFQRNDLTIHGGHENLEERFRGQQSPRYFPIDLDVFPTKISFNQLEEGKKYDIPGGTFSTMRLNHPGGSYGYRIEKEGRVVVLATDSEYKRDQPEMIEKAIEFFKDADIVVFDSMYTLEESLAHEDWGHSSAIIGVDIAVKAKVKSLVLFHHEPNYKDDFLLTLLQKARRYKNLNYENVDLELILAREGLVMQA